MLFSGSMTWTILLFESSRGETPVEQFIKNQSPKTQAKIFHQVNLLSTYGVLLGMPHAKLIGHNMYELRIRGKDEIRIFYCFRKRTIYLLHAFRKHSQKTPPKELLVAITRSGTLTKI